MARHDDMDLMQFHDGELEAGEEIGVSRQLDGSAADRDKLIAIGQVGDVVQTHLEIAADDADPAFDAMWANIERRVNANGASAPLEKDSAAAVPGRVSAPVAPADAGILFALRRWFDANRGHFVTGAVTAGAVAALILLLRSPNERVITKTVHVPPVVELQTVASTPATVEYLDVVDGSGTVLTIPGENDEDSTTVIWIDPDEDVVEGPI